MEIEKTMIVAAPAERVWQLLLDPQVMGGCVPGMQSIEVVSDVEYLAHIHVKIAFISARFKIKTTIVEQRAPHYLRSEGTGEDASVASSLKQQSEIFLDELSDGQTALRMKIKVDVLGRLGTFGLSVMKTKADRMWEEFGANLAARLAPPGAALPGTQAETATAPASTAAMVGAAQPVLPAGAPGLATPVQPIQATGRAPGGWWSRLFRPAPSLQEMALADRRAQRAQTDICIEVRRGDTSITVRWPVQSASECGAWLQRYLA